MARQNYIPGNKINAQGLQKTLKVDYTSPTVEYWGAEVLNNDNPGAHEDGDISYDENTDTYTFVTFTLDEVCEANPGLPRETLLNLGYKDHLFTSAYASFCVLDPNTLTQVSP